MNPAIVYLSAIVFTVAVFQIGKARAQDEGVGGVLAYTILGAILFAEIFL